MEYTIGEKPQSGKKETIVITRDWLEQQEAMFTLQEIADMLGINRRALYKIRKKMGMPMKKPRGRNVQRRG